MKLAIYPCLVAYAVAENEDTPVVAQFEMSSILDFLAGFISTFTGENHLDQFEQCYSGSDSLITDLKKILGDIESGDYISGMADLGPLVGDIQSSMQNCSNFEADFQTLNEWAEQLQEPVGLA